MPKIPIKPPKVTVPNGGFWRQIGMIIIGTTISLAFTLLAAYVTEQHQRAKDRRLSAMMVMSNVEKFSRNLEEIADYMSTADSISAWLLSKPVDELELMPEEELDSLLSQATSLLFLTYDKSTENIFSNNIETWKNMGNVHFIDGVGQCFSAMNTIEERWNNWVSETETTMLDIKDHPDNYEGSTPSIKSLRNEKVRHTLKGIHYWRAWLYYTAATMRYHNRFNMEAIGIEEQEVMDYTDARNIEDGNRDAAPDFNDFYQGPLDPTGLTTFQSLDRQLEALKATDAPPKGIPTDLNN